jgi:hypothetical protein
MSFLDSLEENTTKLLYVVLLEGINIVPLKTLEQMFGEAGLIFSLEIDKEFLQLIRDTVLFGNLLGVVAEYARIYR